MAGFWRFLGITNAAVWLGATVFYVFLVEPLLWSTMPERWVGRPLAGAIAHLVGEDFYRLQVVCAVIALVHLLVDWLHFARPVNRIVLGLLTGGLCLGLLGGSLLLPHLKLLHAVRYAKTSEEPNRDRAARNYRVWNAVAWTANLFVVGGLLVYVWRVANPRETPRYYSTPKFRG